MARDDSGAVNTFVEVSRVYVALIDGASRWRHTDTFLAKVYPALSDVLAAALRLPDSRVIGEESLSATVGLDRWNVKYQRLGQLLGGRNTFWEVFNPREEESPIAGTLADALAEVWSNLRAGLEHLEAGEPLDEVVWLWRFGFWSLWGHHLTDALRLITVDFDDETWR
jgi:Domain of unknown function (DUF5063)